MNSTFSNDYRQTSGNAFYYSSFGQALDGVLNWLQMQHQSTAPNIILPALIPADTVQIIIDAGFEFRFYPITENLQFRVQDIDHLTDARTQAILVRNHFGIPADTIPMQTYAEANGLFLIEDGTWAVERLTGNSPQVKGGCLIIDCSKMLNLPDGGILKMNSPFKSFSLNARRKSSLHSACRLASGKLAEVYGHMTRGADPLSRARRSGRLRNNSLGESSLRSISRLSEWLLRITDLDSIVRTRRTNYRYLTDRIRNFTSVDPISPESDSKPPGAGNDNNRLLYEGFVPACLPVLVPSGVRNLLVGLLQSAGIPCSKPGYASVKNNRWLTEKLVELPVDQGMNRYHLDRIVRCLRDAGSSWLDDSKLLFQDITDTEVVL